MERVRRYKGQVGNFVGLPFLTSAPPQISTAMNWPKIDNEHSHCTECSSAFRNVELIDGTCEACIKKTSKKNGKILARSEKKTVTKAATKFLSAMQEQGKTGASMPKVFEGFWREIGGEDAFGQMMAEEFHKAHGRGLSPEEEELFCPSPKIVLSWYEMISRHAAKTDEGKSLDVGSLDESDLESILCDLAHKALKEDEATRLVAVAKLAQDPKHCREMFLTCLEVQPELATELLAANGIETIDAESVSIPKKNTKQENKTVEGDKPTPAKPESLDTAVQQYDPSEDEYKK